jgi:hypothetical protein
LQTRDPYVTHINDKGFGHVDPEWRLSIL